MIEGARARGLDVTTEAFPYIAATTKLESVPFELGWQERLGITFSDLLWVDTDERVTEESFARYRRQGGVVVVFLHRGDGGDRDREPANNDRE